MKHVLRSRKRYGFAHQLGMSLCFCTWCIFLSYAAVAQTPQPNGYLDAATDKWIPNYGASAKYVFPTTTGNISGQITDSVLSGMAVKRVIALTQQGASVNDGSYSHSNVFSGGQISKGAKDDDGNLIAAPEEGGWPLSAVAQGETGYAPGGKDGDDNWVIDFDYTGMPGPNLVPGTPYPGPDGTTIIPAPTYDPNGRKKSDGTYRHRQDAARYPAETVHINLKKAVPVEGEPIRPGRSSLVTPPQ